jgi:hypothetical protein
MDWKWIVGLTVTILFGNLAWIPKVRMWLKWRWNRLKTILPYYKLSLQVAELKNTVHKGRPQFEKQEFYYYHRIEDKTVVRLKNPKNSIEETLYFCPRCYSNGEIFVLESDARLEGTRYWCCNKPACEFSIVVYSSHYLKRPSIF